MQVYFVPRGPTLDSFSRVGYLNYSSDSCVEVVSMLYVVEFHADGGQMCVSGHRSFTDPEKAKQFADKMRSEPDHTCGPESVREYVSDTDLGNEGAIYPEVANIGRHL